MRVAHAVDVADLSRMVEDQRVDEEHVGARSADRDYDDVANKAADAGI